MEVAIDSPGHNYLASSIYDFIAIQVFSQRDDSTS
jgi:hypothetical protein